jgi:CBS domain-containing protein
MGQGPIGSLPVLDGDRLVGIVTATDVLDRLASSTSRAVRPRRPTSSDRPGASVVFEERGATLEAAVDGAVAGVERAVRRSAQRRRMTPLKGGRRRRAGST